MNNGQNGLCIYGNDFIPMNGKFGPLSVVSDVVMQIYLKEVVN